MKTEYANGEQRGSSAFEGLARHAGVPLATVIEYAEQGRLGELVERRQHTRPRSGTDALRLIEQRRHPGTGGKSLSPGAAQVILRRYMSRWDAEVREADRRGARESRRRLAEIRAKRGVV